jgi:hypothetical protein
MTARKLKLGAVSVLLRQPNGFEGIASVGIEGRLCDLAVAHGPYGCTHHADLDSHPSSSSVVADQDDNVVTRINHLLYIGAIALPRVEPVKPRSPETVKPRVSDSLSGRPVLDDCLEVLVEQRRNGLRQGGSRSFITKQAHQVSIAAREKAPDKFHVLLRHRPRSIPQVERAA